MISMCTVAAAGDDFQVIQQEIQMMRECQHQNIVAYYGSYLRYCFHAVTFILDSFMFCLFSLVGFLIAQLLCAVLFCIISNVSHYTDGWVMFSDLMHYCETY